MTIIFIAKNLLLVNEMCNQKINKYKIFSLHIKNEIMINKNKNNYFASWLFTVDLYLNVLTELFFDNQFRFSYI